MILYIDYCLETGKSVWNVEVGCMISHSISKTNLEKHCNAQF